MRSVRQTEAIIYEEGGLRYRKRRKMSRGYQASTRMRSECEHIQDHPVVPLQRDTVQSSEAR